MRSYQRTPAASLTPTEIQAVWELATLHTPDWEIAHYLDFTTKTWQAYKIINPGIQDLINKARAAGSHSLRKAQMQAALNGNTQMQIWLGRHILGQNENLNQLQPSGQPIQLADITPEARQRLLELRNAIYKPPSETIKEEIDIDIETIDSTDVKSSEKILDPPNPGTVGSDDDDHE